MPTETIVRKSPEEWLASTENERTRGRLKVFLGYAPGVGKTHSMLAIQRFMSIAPHCDVHIVTQED